MRYLVTGGAGFIGSNTVDELVRRGHSVVVLDDLSSGKEDNLAEIRNKITFIKGSITDIEVVRKAMQPQPISPYGVTKFVGELYGQTFGRCYGLENVALRYFNIFGPRQDPSSPYSGVLAKFCTAFLEDTQPVIFGDGEQTRDFTYVENAVQANSLACEAPNVSGKGFNVCVGGRVSVNEVVRELGKITGKTLEAKYEPPREGDIRDSQADISQAREFLGYSPQVSFEEGLARTFEWYRETQAKAAVKTEK